MAIIKQGETFLKRFGSIRPTSGGKINIGVSYKKIFQLWSADNNEAFLIVSWNINWRNRVIVRTQLSKLSQVIELGPSSQNVKYKYNGLPKLWKTKLRSSIGLDLDLPSNVLTVMVVFTRITQHSLFYFFNWIVYRDCLTWVIIWC